MKIAKRNYESAEDDTLSGIRKGYSCCTKKGESMGSGLNTSGEPLNARTFPRS